MAFSIPRKLWAMLCKAVSSAVDPGAPKAPARPPGGKRGGGELKLEDVAEEEAAAKPQPKPARKLPAPGQTGKPAGAPTPSKSTPSKAAAPSPAGAGKNGYTGPAWPEKDAKPKAESGGRRGRG